MKFFETLKTVKMALGVGTTVVAFIVAATIFAGDVKDIKEKVSQFEQIQQDNSNIRLEMSRMQSKLLDMFMKFYELDPDSIRKWKEIPPKPELTSSGDTVAYAPWCRIVNFDSIVMYEIRKQNGRMTLWESTLYPTDTL